MRNWIIIIRFKLIMKSTRENILRTLLAYPNSSIKALSEAVGINGISIRHHLSALEAEDLIISKEERHGVGRPRLIYSLTEKGVEQFPTNYLRLTLRLISTLKNSLTQEQFTQIFEKIGEEIVERYDFEPKDKTIGQRLEFLQKVLTNEGFIVNWEVKDGAYRISSLSCPYYQIRLDYPVICKLDHAVISAFFESPVKITSCIFTGDERCTYEIQAGIENGHNHE